MNEKPQRIAIVGTRKWNRKDAAIVLEKLFDYIHSLPEDAVIITGGAPGIDSTAEMIAKDCCLEVKIFLPDWDKHPRSAGMIRNAEILNDCDKVIAFWDGESPGTKGMIELARRRNLPLRVILF